MFSDITAARMWCFVLFLSHWLKSFPLLPHFFLINFCSTKESSPWTAPAVLAASLWNGRAHSRALPLLNRGGPAGGFPKTASSSFRSVFTWRQVTSHCSAPKAFTSPATQRGSAPSRAGEAPPQVLPDLVPREASPEGLPTGVLGTALLSVHSDPLTRLKKNQNKFRTLCVPQKISVLGFSHIYFRFGLCFLQN